ncbi:Pyruvate carboxylase [Desulfurella amilsii]|uniref:Pyruvate carboxylase n=1 Tax=Desulfurella amilsii TaxID=1562698 RepID=A0A1X4XYR2_9BACT|nr:pyruvate carboxylase [Desulfurella amilsii]OSS42653.1 Pyruvate carboxylase [Desulfurella amilsii]
MKIKRLLVTNRGEIAIRIFRAATELNIETIGIYSYEDRYSLHRYKCDESYLVGEGKSPVDAYLSIEEIIDLAKSKHIDAIHPGYGFLSENPLFAKKYEEAGIIFIGPHSSAIEIFGDKLRAKKMAQNLSIPTIPGTNQCITSINELREFANQSSYPILIKATKGGGGRGIRVVETLQDLESEYLMAKSESLKAFGSDEIIAEKLVKNPKHIEVQILGDKFGNYVHLFERDCSIQRRHQKVVEIAPSLNIPQDILQSIYADSIKFAKETKLYNAATFEYLVDEEKQHYYFLEVNPRLQVEHTVTEIITSIDIVQSQIKIASDQSLLDFIGPQDKIAKKGCAFQCRITTEDPQNNFFPDTGKIEAYRSPAGFGIRLDAASAYTGALITPFYDSLLVKITAFGLTFEEAAKKMHRALREFRIRGIKNNLRFLENLVSNKDFLKGDFNVHFLETHPEIFNFEKPRDRISKLLRFLGNNIVNKPNGEAKNVVFPTIVKPKAQSTKLEGLRDILLRQGPEIFIQKIKESKEVLFTDTTFRDAHQSLLATRMRTKDLLEISDFVAKRMNKLFSIEMWGGATFDVCYRFLKEDPWERLDMLRQRIPNIPFQMLLRGANAVGYTNYPDNVVKAFIKEAVGSGIDVFRIFDCFNWTDQMAIAMEEVKKLDRICEAAISYTDDVLSPKNNKYTLSYYVDLAKKLEKMGADIIAIKDMAGLLKPYAAKVLFKTLSEEVGVPLHFHTHNTSGNAESSVYSAIEAGVKIVDAAVSSMSGLTSQPSLNSIVAALKNTPHQSSLNQEDLDTVANYFEKVRPYYFMFESGLKSPTAEVYEHEIPGGQYSNLKPQVTSLGLLDRWDDIKKMYKQVNEALGNLIKVTPSSKVVGDLALFLVRNNLTIEDFKNNADKLSLPQSVVDFFKGYLGQPYGGFDRKLQQKVLKGETPLAVRPGEILTEYNLNLAQEALKSIIGSDVEFREVVSYALYGKVIEDYFNFNKEYGDVWVLSTKDFFFPLNVGEETIINLEEGKTIFVKLIAIGEADSKGQRTLTFEVNGESRFVTIKDLSLQAALKQNLKGDKSNSNHIIATMPGKISKMLVREGDFVNKNQPVCITEAMKMETKIVSLKEGKVKNILLKEGEQIEGQDLIIELE